MSRNKRDKPGGHSPFWITPSWFTRMFMTKPQRHRGRMWEKDVVKLDTSELEDTDPPDVSKKPHKYFW